MTKSKGFKEILADSGLNDNLIISSLVQDIKKKPQNRVRELTLAIKLLAMEQKALTKEKITSEGKIDYRSLTDEELNEIIAQCEGTNT